MSITVKDLCFTYAGPQHVSRHTLNHINLTIEQGEFIGLIGRTGSGKSTLIQHLNGLLKGTSGDILYNGESIYANNYNLRKLRQKVGLVFQYPEHQLFEETVLKDICFGPKNQGLDEEACKERAREAMRLVGLKEEDEQVSPFDISGGQKRRVAIAGVLAMKPDVLVLDEPTAGLDPQGRKRILDQIKKLQQETNITVILVSHSMEDVANYADRLLVMNGGELVYDGTPEEIFPRYEDLEAMGLSAPEVTYVMHELKKAGLPVDTGITTIPEAAKNIVAVLKG